MEADRPSEHPFSLFPNASNVCRITGINPETLQWGINYSLYAGMMAFTHFSPSSLY